MKVLAKTNGSSAPVRKIKTDQSLVHIKHSITIRQYKYWHLLLKFFNEQLEEGIAADEDGFYYESRNKLTEYFGYEIMTKELKLDFEGLRKEPIIINYLEKDGKSAIHGMGFISEYKITSTKIGFRLPSFIEKVIKGEEESKKLFLLLNWNIFNSFTGKYEAIIYKLCKDYVGIGRTPYFSIDEYREYIGLKDGDYTAIDNLTRRCLKNPVSNINKNEISDIEVEIEYKKQAKKIEGVYFKVKHKKQTILPFDEPQTSKAFELAKVAISLENQTKYLQLYTEEEIQATIERANEYVEQLKASGRTVTIGAIYNKAFSENWGEQRLQEKLVRQQEKQQEEKKRQKGLEKKANEQKASEDAEMKKALAIEELLNQFDLLETSVKSEIVDSILQKNKAFKAGYNVLNNAYLEHGFQAYKHNEIFKGHLITALKEHNKEAKKIAYEEEEQQLILNFENLTPFEKSEEIKIMLKLKKSNKAIYDVLNDNFLNFGVNAHKQSQDFYCYLVEHLVMSKIVKE